jgi:hypothetical protein
MTHKFAHVVFKCQQKNVALNANKKIRLLWSQTYLYFKSCAVIRDDTEICTCNLQMPINKCARAFNANKKDQADVEPPNELLTYFEAVSLADSLHTCMPVRGLECKKW